MAQAHVQVVLADSDIPENLDAALRRADVTTSFRPLSDALRAGVATSADAVVIVVPDDMRAIAPQLKVLFERLAEHPRAALVMKARGGLVPRIAHPPALPVSFGCESGEAELATRIRTMLDMRPSLTSLRADSARQARSAQSLAERYAAQMRIASQVQRDLMPKMLPQMGPFTFSTLFRPVDFVSGDIFDVQRLDDVHIGIALADAAGHGIPAALLTVFIKRALRGQAARERRTAVLEPDEVLRQLNTEILDANIAECRFVAVTYALLNTATREMSIARAGMPYPILRRADGEMALLQPAGGVVGVVPDGEFAVETLTLTPGDAVLFYSDGLETLLAPQVSPTALAQTFDRVAKTVRESSALADGATVVERADGRVAGAELAIGGSADSATATATSSASATPPANAEITRTSWFETLRTQGVSIAVDELILRHDALRRMGHKLDDLTVLTLHCA